MRHGTHMNGSWRTHEWVMAHVWMSHGTHTNTILHHHVELLDVSRWVGSWIGGWVVGCEHLLSTNTPDDSNTPLSTNTTSRWVLGVLGQILPRTPPYSTSWWYSSWHTSTILSQTPPYSTSSCRTTRRESLGGFVDRGVFVAKWSNFVTNTPLFYIMM